MGQESILAAAARYTAAHNRVKDNPQKLVDANRKGAEEYTRVSDECGKGMEELHKAEQALFKAVDDFLATHENPVVAAAIRFCQAASGVMPFSKEMFSSRSKDRTPEGQAAIDEYFASRQALFDVVQKSQTHRFIRRDENEVKS